MPELAEVFYHSKNWTPGLGQTVQSIELHGNARVFRGGDVAALEDGLLKRKLQGIHTHGKQMLFDFSGGQWLWLHLGMTGALSAPAQPYEATKHDHLVLHLRERTLVFNDPRQFGAVRHYASKGFPEFWQALPPQVQDETFTLELLTSALARHGRTPLKALLLDQAIFPGIGNWMADEVMWQIKLPPQTLAGALGKAQLKTLHRTLRKICQVSLATIGVDWGDPPNSWLFRHRWEKGHACPRCQAALVREELRGRTACWCPTCQPG
jgi:formamidopyrimidine-DNA glycosylase